MRKSLVVAGAMIVLALALCMVAQAQGTRGGGDTTVGGPAHENGGRPAATEGRGGRPGADNRPGPGGPGGADNPEMLHRLVTVAATAPWALADADAQKALDKVLADRKTVLKDETDRIAAYEKLMTAARAKDEAGVKAAEEALKATTEKIRQNARSMGEDGRALVERLNTIKPADFELMPRPPARREKGGDAKGGDVKTGDNAAPRP